MQTSSSSNSIVIIPARGGSKGIPHKNIQDLGGLPLLAHSILVAKAATRVNRVVVSTDDKEIAETARAYGAEVPFFRPTALSGDKALIGEAIAHMLEGLRMCEGYVPDVVVELYPSHPFRSPELVDRLLGRLDEGYQSVVTVRPIHLNKHLLCVINPTGTMRCLRADNAEGARTAMRNYGVFYAYSLKQKPLGVYVHQLHDPKALIDIDDSEDLALARRVLNKYEERKTTGLYHEGGRLKSYSPELSLEEMS